MTKSIKLGDTRILEARYPDLNARLLRKIDVGDGLFLSPEFNAAMKATRSGMFDALEDFLSEGMTREEYYGNAGAPIQVADADGNFSITAKVDLMVPEGVERGKLYGDMGVRIENRTRVRFAGQETWDCATGPVEPFAYFSWRLDDKHMSLFPLSKVRLAPQEALYFNEAIDAAEGLLYEADLLFDIVQDLADSDADEMYKQLVLEKFTQAEIDRRVLTLTASLSAGGTVLTALDERFASLLETYTDDIRVAELRSKDDEVTTKWKTKLGIAA